MNNPKFLDDVNIDHLFRMNSGQTIRNIYELVDAIEHSSQSTYDYHANSQKNDFSKWLEFTIGDKELASMIRSKSKQDALHLIKKRIFQLEEEIEQEKVKGIVGKEEPNIEEQNAEKLMEPDIQPEIQTTLKTQNHEPENYNHKKHDKKLETDNITNKDVNNEIELKVSNHFLNTLKNNLELFLLGIVIGILIGKFLLGTV